MIDSDGDAVESPPMISSMTPVNGGRNATIALITSEASYHASYDHCIVKFMNQVGLHPTWIKLAELGIKGNSHNMMQEKNSDDIAAVIHQWLAKTLPAKR